VSHKGFRLIGWFCLALVAVLLGWIVHLSGRKFPPVSSGTILVLFLLAFLCAIVGHGLLQSVKRSRPEEGQPDESDES